MMNTGMDQMVAQLRAVAAQTAQTPAVPEADTPGFSVLLRSAIEDTNAAQLEAKGLSRKFESGDPEVSLQDVVLSLQKASLSFQTMVQVRNKLVSAYQEIMNMQV